MKYFADIGKYEKAHELTQREVELLRSVLSEIHPSPQKIEEIQEKILKHHSATK